MILNPADSLKDTWESIFRRKGGDGVYTRLFDNLDIEQQDMLLSKFTVADWEIPVIGSSQDPDNWLVLTTGRLVWSLDGNRQEIPAAAVSDAIPDKKDLWHISNKLKMRRLQVITVNSDKYLIEIEPGAPLIGVWNVLKHLGKRNQNTRQ
jgi:hypothetical protein